MNFTKAKIFWETIGFIVQIIIGYYDIYLLVSLHVLISIIFLFYIIEGNLDLDKIPLNIIVTYTALVILIILFVTYVLRPFNNWLNTISFKTKTK
jgi:hypothetical protein